MISDREQVEKWLEKYKNVVSPFVKEQFIVDHSVSADYTKFTHGKITMVVASQKGIAGVSKVLLQDASSFNYEHGEHQNFIKRLSEKLKIHQNLLLQAIDDGKHCARLQDSLSSAIDNLTSTVDYHGGSSIVTIYPYEMDPLKYIIEVLNMLKHPFRYHSPHGIVIFCGSIPLMIPLFILVTIVKECTLAKGLFSFVPCQDLEGPGEPHVGRLLSVVLNPCDLDCVVREWIDAVQLNFTSYWRCPTMLVEESSMVKFVEKCKHVLSLKKQLTPNDCSTDRIDYEHLDSLVKKYGATLISSGDVNEPPCLYLVGDISPPAISQLLHKHPGPIGYILPFRVPKEALSMVSYFVNLEKCYRKSTKLDFVLSTWTQAAGLPWYFASGLGKLGVRNIFVNTPYDHILRKLYQEDLTCLEAELLPRSIANCPRSESTSNEFANALRRCSAAQTKLSGKKHELIREELMDAVKGSSMDLAHLNAAWTQFVRRTDAALGGPSVYSLEYKEGMPSLMCHRWVASSGPIIFYCSKSATYSEEYVTFLTVFTFQCILAGNALLCVFQQDAISSNAFSKFFEIVDKLRSSSSDDIIQVIELPSSSIREIECLAAGNPGGLIIDPFNLWTSQKDHQNVSFGISRVLKLCFTIGSDTFPS